MMTLPGSDWVPQPDSPAASSAATSTEATRTEVTRTEVTRAAEAARAEVTRTIAGASRPSIRGANGWRRAGRTTAGN
jgi:hypothetical protein